MKKKIIFSGFERKIEDARKNERVISTKKISYRYNDRNPKSATTNRILISMYEYKLNGKIGKYQVVSTSVPHIIFYSVFRIFLNFKYIIQFI